MRTLLLVIGLLWHDANLATAQFAPRFFKLEGVPGDAGAARAAWAQQPNGAWVARCYGGLLQQAGGRWIKIPPPASDIIVQLAPYEGGLLAASANCCWLHEGRGWRMIFKGDEIKSLLADGAAAFFTSRGSVFQVDAEGGVRPLAIPPDKQGDLVLRRLAGRLCAIDQDRGDVLAWDGSAFNLLAGVRLPLRQTNHALVRGPRSQDVFYFDGQQAQPAELIPPATATAVRSLAKQWPHLQASMLPETAGALMGRHAYFATPAGVEMHALTGGGKARVLRPTEEDEVLQNLQPTNDGLLASGQRGFYLLPDPDYVQFATIPGVIYDMILTRSGLVLLSTKGQFLIDGSDARLNRPLALGLLELKSGEFVSAEPGLIRWGPRVIPFPELKTEQVIMIELSDDRIALSQLVGSPQVNGVVLLGRDGRQERIITPAVPFYIAPLVQARGFLVYTKEGVHRYDPAGRRMDSFGRGNCFPALDRGQYHTMDEDGLYYDETGRVLGRMPFTLLMSALHWREDFYVLGRTREGRHVAGRYDLASGRLEPLDLPASRTLVELRVQDDALMVVCEGEVLRLTEPRFITPPAIRTRFMLPGGGAVPEKGLPPSQSDVELTLPAPRLGPWQSPAYTVRVGEGVWLPAEAGSTLVLPRLAYGANEIVVRAELAGLESHATQVIWRLRPWWLDWPGALLATMSASLGIVGLLRWRTRVLQRRNQALERIISVRTEQLQQASAAKNQFITRLNHEIRNPMNGMIGMARMVAARARDMRDELLADSLHACAEQLRATLDDVLDFSSVEEGRLNLVEEDFEVLELVRTTCRRFDQVGDTIRCVEPLPPPCWCRGDQGKLRLVLGNYLSNARKYGTPPRADVRVQIAPADAGQIRLTLQVINPGPTLAPDELARSFHPFERGRRADETGVEGTGIGLSLCRNYARAMGGSVGAESERGLTTFWIEVPLRRIEPGTVAPDCPLPALRVLAIEDERYNRLVLGHYLAEMQLGVDWATSFTEAFELVAKNPYDVILSDWSLPDMPGREALATLRARFGDRVPPVVVISAHATTELRRQIIEAGATDFLSKPVSPARLRATLAQLSLAPPAADPDKPPIPPAPDAADDTPDFQRLLHLGSAADILPAFRSDLEQAFASARADAAIDPAQAGAKLHALRSLALLVRARPLDEAIRQLEITASQAHSSQELDALFSAAAREIEALNRAIDRAVKSAGNDRALPP